jgi:RimJ/RimL family protein N-acetyltransferase
VAIEFRQMIELDIPGFQTCFDVVAKERRHLGRLTAPSLDECRAWLLPHLQQNRPAIVALNGAQVIGWCDITPHKYEGFTHRGRLGMGVHPDFRNRGVGTRVLQLALAGALNLGLERVELEVFTSNLAARRLYEKAGFVVEGILRRARKLGGDYDDLVQMALFLNPPTDLELAGERKIQ